MPTHNVTETEINPALGTGSGGGLAPSSVTELNPVGAGIGGGGKQSFTLTETNPNLPVLANVQTNAASAVTGKGAFLNGTLVDEGLLGAACNCGFQWGTTIGYGNTTAPQSKITGQAFAQAVSLLPNTTYHFRSYATNALGTAFGADQQFTTPIITPIVVSTAASHVGLYQATLNATLTDDGGAPCNCCFEWGTTTAYGNVTPIQLVSIGQSFSAIIVNLIPSTMYHFRAVASNGI